VATKLGVGPERGVDHPLKTGMDHHEPLPWRPLQDFADIQYTTAGWVDSYNHRGLDGTLEWSPQWSSRKPTTPASRHPLEGESEAVTVHGCASDYVRIVTPPDSPYFASSGRANVTTTCRGAAVRA